MSKIRWETSVAGRHTGTDGLGVVVNAKQAMTASGDQQLLHVDLLVYLDEPIADPRPAIEAAVSTLRKELGL